VQNKDRLNQTELRTAAALASIFFLRMLGLFMLLPVLALYASRIEGATPFLIGAALGIYGLTQAALQIPLGRWSDHVGRKPVIAIGLLIFTAGGVVAAITGQITAIIAGRALQGAGAISGAVLALASDLTRPQHRTKVMALIGISIGLAFSSAFVLGPWLDSVFGLVGLFWISAALGLVAIPILMYAVPKPPRFVSAEPGEARQITWPPPRGLLSLYIGVFCLHGILAASFVSIPVLLQEGLGLESGRHFRIYIPVLIVSMLCVTPMIMLSHRARVGRALFQLAILTVLLGELVLWLGPMHKMTVAVGLTAFFIGFNFLEASLPSMVSRAAPETGRGGALGTYSTAQFVGLFIGGLGGGALFGSAGFRFVFAIAALVAGSWLIYSILVPVEEATDTDRGVG